MSELKTEYDTVRFERYSIFNNDWGIHRIGSMNQLGELDSTGRITLFVPPFAGAVRTNVEELRDIFSFMESLTHSTPKGKEQE